jgi:hypothetical protein
MEKQIFLIKGKFSIELPTFDRLRQQARKGKV